MKPNPDHPYASRLMLLGALTALLFVGTASYAQATDIPEDRLQRFDRNGDGQISDRERQGAERRFNRVDRNSDGQLGPRERQQARRQFNHADRNNNGRIEPRERRVAHQRFERGNN